jgi:hypothetical protein
MRELWQDNLKAHCHQYQNMIPPFFVRTQQITGSGRSKWTGRKELRQKTTAGVYRDADLYMLAKEK